MEWKEYKCNVNGHLIIAKYHEEDIQYFKNIIEKIELLYEQKKERMFVFIAAPPGCGKSTLVAFLETIAWEMGYKNVQSIGMDGFHYPNEYLDYHFCKDGLLRDFKGCPESFDFNKLKSYIEQSKQEDFMWPVYDRIIHNPKEHAVLVNKDIILLEGNYLLLDEEPWNSLIHECEYSIYMDADIDLLKQRLIQRKAKGTTTDQEAERFYEKSDAKNIVRVQQNRLKSDVVLHVNGSGRFDVIVDICQE